MLTDNSKFGRSARVHFHGGRAWCLLSLGACRGRGRLDSRSSRAMAGEESRCSISLIFLEAPKVLEFFLRLVVAFFLKRAKCISTGTRQINKTMSENERITLMGGALAKISVDLFF